MERAAHPADGLHAPAPETVPREVDGPEGRVLGEGPGDVSNLSRPTPAPWVSPQMVRFNKTSSIFFLGSGFFVF